MMHIKKIALILLFLIIISCSINSKSLKFGIISDIHGNPDIDVFLKTFQKENVDAILVLGDINDMDKVVYSKNDYEEIDSVLEKIAETSKPVFIIPGNHEPKEDYLNVTDALVRKYRYFYDLSDWKIVEFKGFNIVPVPGYDVEEYTNENGFLFYSEDLSVLDIELENLSNVLLIAHGPPKGKNAHSIDALSSGENVGNLMLEQIMKKHGITFGVFGHIHEAGMKAVDEEDEIVPENTWSNSLRLNPGPAIKWKMNSGKESEGSAAILEIDIVNKKAGYEIIEV